MIKTNNHRQMTHDYSKYHSHSSLPYLLLTIILQTHYQCYFCSCPLHTTLHSILKLYGTLYVLPAGQGGRVIISWWSFGALRNYDTWVSYASQELTNSVSVCIYVSLCHTLYLVCIMIVLVSKIFIGIFYGWVFLDYFKCVREIDDGRVFFYLNLKTFTTSQKRKVLLVHGFSFFTVVAPPKDKTDLALIYSLVFKTSF